MDHGISTAEHNRLQSSQVDNLLPAGLLSRSLGSVASQNKVIKARRTILGNWRDRSILIASFRLRYFTCREEPHEICPEVRTWRPWLSVHACRQRGMRRRLGPRPSNAPNLDTKADLGFSVEHCRLWHPTRSLTGWGHGDLWQCLWYWGPIDWWWTTSWKMLGNLSCVSERLDPPLFDGGKAPQEFSSTRSSCWARKAAPKTSPARPSSLPCTPRSLATKTCSSSTEPAAAGPVIRAYFVWLFLGFELLSYHLRPVRLLPVDFGSSMDLKGLCHCTCDFSNSIIVQSALAFPFPGEQYQPRRCSNWVLFGMLIS